MKIGLPKEIKDNEYRVGLVPSGVKALTSEGHSVLVETNAGSGSGFSDNEYLAAGAQISRSADEVWAAADMVVKVKEPIAPEYARLKPGLLLFTYLHLAPDPKQTEALLSKKTIGIAYETIVGKHGGLPLLTPMSEVAGRMSVQVGTTYLMKPNGGRGILLGGVPGVAPGEVVIVGGGVVGLNAAKVAVGLGARVTILETSGERMAYLDDIFGSRVVTLASNPYTLAEGVAEADVLVGAVLIPGAAAPKLVSRDMIRTMKKGSVVVDVAVDQGGCFETTKATTHSKPVYDVDGVTHYCVANMPGAVPRTSTLALTNVTLPYALKIARLGLGEAIRRDRGLKEGINTYEGALTCQPVAAAQGKEYTPLDQLLAESGGHA
jgi:alanine dehydrogenase